jgi:type 1 fimbria pilin
VSYFPAVFTSTVPACYIAYGLTKADGTSLPAALMTFDVATRELVVQSNNNIYAGIYNLKMTAVVAGAVSAVATFKVTVLH